MQERRPWKTEGDLIVINQLMMNSCVASGVLFSFGFSPHNFSSLRFFRGVFSHGQSHGKLSLVSAPRKRSYQNNAYEVTSRCCPDGVFVKTSTGQLFFSWLTPASAFVRSHSCWMHVSGACCLNSVYIIFSGSAHKVADPTWVVKCSAWCTLSLNRSRRAREMGKAWEHLSCE